ncbi:MAG: peptidylprolyl isomerase [Bacteroidales bacterium]|jgi:FKBP-type peptidyl-prolyl cis-trans isomerase SlyD
MVISKDKVVSLTYELRIDGNNGEIVEALKEDSPLTFLYGSGNLLPKFEQNISGLKIGDEFSFDIKAEDAYGEVNENAVVNVPVSAFEIDGKIDSDMLKVGNKIPMQDASGNKLTGIVKEVTDEAVNMDFNHPMAGNDLFFNGKVTEIRDATEEELHHGHAHYPGSCEGCEDCGNEGGHC